MMSIDVVKNSIYIYTIYDIKIEYLCSIDKNGVIKTFPVSNSLSPPEKKIKTESHPLKHENILQPGWSSIKTNKAENTIVFNIFINIYIVCYNSLL